MKDRFKEALGLAALLWVLIVITAYFVVQKPWPPNNGVRALAAAIDIGLASLMVILAGGLGRRILGPLGSLHRLEGAALQVGLGLGIINLAILAIGVLGLLGPWSAWLGLIAGLALLWTSALDWLRALAESAAGEKPSGAISWGAAILIGTVISVSLLEALAPPLKWDSLVYHLALPQNYLADGQIGFVSGNLFVGFPQLAELHYTWAMALRAETTAAVLGWAVGVIAVLGLAGFAARLLGSNSLWLAPAILLSGASLWQGLSWAYVDHWVLLFGLGLFVSLERHSNTSNNRWLWQAGIFIGLAASAKYTGGLLGLAAVLWLVVGRGKEARAEGGLENPGSMSSGSSWLVLFTNLVKITLIALLVFSPWLIKNWLTTGNPLYPFLWPGREIDALRQTFHAQGESTLRYSSIPLLPWLVTVLGVEGGAGFNSSIGPLYLALIPGLLFHPWKSNSKATLFLRRAAMTALLGWALWGIGGTIADPLSRSRHYYGFLPILALLATAGYQSLVDLKMGEIRIGWVISRLLLFAFALVLVDGLFHLATRNPFPTLMGQQADKEYLAEQLGWYGPAMDAMEQLPPDAEVEMLWEARSLYCSRTCNPDVILDKWWYWRRTIGDGAAIANTLKEQGISHVLIYDFGAEFERRTRELQDPEDWQALADFRADQLELIQSFGEGYSLYTWTD